MFMLMSEERSGMAGLLRLVMDILEKVSELRDRPSSLHFRVMSFEQSRYNNIIYHLTIVKVQKNKNLYIYQL